MCIQCGPDKVLGENIERNGFCSHTCRQENKARWAVPKAFRASCAEFTAAGVCKVGDLCYERHCIASERLAHDLLVLCARSHATRVIEYLGSGELAGGLRLEVLGEHTPDVTSEKAKGRSDNRLLFARILAEGADRNDMCSRARVTIAEDLNLANVVDRVYVVSTAIATNALALPSVAADFLSCSELALGVQVMAFPPALQKELAEAVLADCRFELQSAHNANAGVCAVAFADRTEVGAFFGQAPPRSPVSPMEVLPCRAALKLREVQRRCRDVWPARETWTAADIGASPGGWTSVLVDAGAAHVFAIDPGELNALVAARPEVEHVAKRVEDYAPALVAKGVLLDMIVCDMNCNPRMSVDAVLSLLSAARPGATLVVTLKKFGSKANMASAIDVEVTRLRKVLGTSLRMLHLFSGGLDEQTVAGRLVAADECNDVPS